MEASYTGFGIEEIFLLIGLRGRTGELVLESGNNLGSVLFHRGAILHAFSPYARAIGDLLVEDGVINEAELLEFLRLQKIREYCPLGTLVMRTGKVSFEAIELLVHEQIRQSVKEFSGWKNLNISFVEKAVAPFDAIHLPVHEFIRSDTLKTAYEAVTRMMVTKDESAAPAAPTM